MSGIEIPERDWKRWRALREVALQRYCDKILEGVVKFRNSKDSAHDRYLKLWKHLHKHDGIIAIVFNDPSRSKAYIQMHAALKHGIISREELFEMSEQTQQLIEVWLK